VSYIDTAISKNGKFVFVWERDENDKLQLVKELAPYYCYVEDPEGSYKSIFPDRPPLALKTFGDRWHMKAFVEGTKDNNHEDAHDGLIFESDIEPDLKILAGSKYYRKSAPNLHVTFLDIEADADLQKYGWPTIDNPYGEINAISLCHRWENNKLILLGLTPKGDKTLPIKEDFQCDELYLFENESQLLGKFIELIQDSDVLSGWNSDKFDIPYIIERLKIYVEEDQALEALCRGGFKAKAKEIKVKWDKKLQIIYKLFGRVSLDYMQVYKRFTFSERPSYSLENISTFELGYGKLEYAGSLPNLYRANFKKFLEYNLHDVILLRDLDRKLQFFALLNDMAHDCTVRLHDVLGTVVLTDQALMAYAWHEKDQKIPDRGSEYGLPTYKSWINSEEGMKERNEAGLNNPFKQNDNRFVGAYVHNLVDEKRGINKRGLHGYTASMDIESEYPNTIIALNVSPETVIFDPDEFDHILWDKKMAWETGIRWGARKDIIGLVPEVSTYWLDQRVELKKKMKEATTKEEKAYYKRLQHVKKIQLNSAYGALANQYSHFYNLAFAEAITFGGQGIVKHMIKTIGIMVDDHHPTQDEHKDLNTPSIIYGDTDSCYFDLPDVESPQEAIVYADYIAQEVNKTFPEYMIYVHGCDARRANRIKAGREIVADRSLFVDKKRYALHVIDDGSSVDKLEIKGLEVVQSSTPKVIQELLRNILVSILQDKKNEKEIAEIVHTFRQRFNQDLSLEEIGMPKGIKGIEDYADRIRIRELWARKKRIEAGFSNEKPLTEEEENDLREALRSKAIDPVSKKTRRQQIEGKGCPGHVLASLNWNQMLDETGDKTRSKIASGMKIKVYYLLKNSHEFTCIAIPTDEVDVPQWFRDLPFDMKKMGKVLIDSKLKAMYASLKWAIPKEGTDDTTFEGFIEF